MNAECFLDANVLVYAVARRGQEEPKRSRARELIGAGRFGLSAQVLQEFYVTVTRKIRKPLPPGRAARWIEQLALRPCAPIDSNLVKIAAALSARYRISYWDAALVAAAEVLGATTLYTEDLNHGQLYGSVRAVNPFLTA